MSIEYPFCTGRPLDVVANLRRSLARRLNFASNVKVGITCNPETRWKQHRWSRPSWTKMVVVYRSTSIQHVRILEAELIEHGGDRLYNSVGGGGGNFASGLQYLYFLIQK